MKITRKQLRDLILKEISISNQKDLDSNTMTEALDEYTGTLAAGSGENNDLLLELIDAIHAIEAALGGEGIELKPHGNYEPRAVK